MTVDALLECRAPGWLHVSPVATGPCLVVTIAGEADWVTAAQLENQLVMALDYGPRSLILDLTELVFCNLRGLAALHAAIAAAQEAGVDVTLRGMSRQLTWLHTAVTRRPRPGAQENGGWAWRQPSQTSSGTADVGRSWDSSGQL